MNIHIMPRPEGWALKKGSNSRASRIYRTKKKAKKKGRRKAKKMSRGNMKKTNLVIHRKNGSIQETRTY